MLNIVAVSGSLRNSSTNTTLLDAAIHLAPPDLSIKRTDLIGQLPLFNPDLDVGEIEVVQRWTALMRESNALILSTPEYARGYPGALKNALDWLVQGDAFVEKPFMFFVASERAHASHTTLAVVISTMSGVHISDADVTIPLLGTDNAVSDIVQNDLFSSRIKNALALFSEQIRSKSWQS